MHGHIYKPEEVEAVLPRLARSSLDDLLAHVGRGEIDPLDVLAAVDRDWVRPEALTIDGMGSEVSAEHMARQAAPEPLDLPILGSHHDLPIRLSEDGGALPGEKIVGILDPGVGITIYPADAKAIKAFKGDPERLLDLTWDMSKAQDKKYSARFLITARHTPGTLAMVATVIAAHDGNITNFNINVPAEDFAEMQFDVEVWNVKHLERILKELAAKPSTAKVKRVLG